MISGLDGIYDRHNSGKVMEIFLGLIIVVFVVLVLHRHFGRRAMNGPMAKLLERNPDVVRKEPMERARRAERRAESKKRTDATTVPVRCPYCEFMFEKMPGRKRKCPACKNTVFPRRAPGKNVKRLVSDTFSRLEIEGSENVRERVAASTAKRGDDGNH